MLLPRLWQEMKGTSIAWEALGAMTLAKGVSSLTLEKRLAAVSRSYGLAESKWIREKCLKILAPFLGTNSEEWERGKIGWNRYAEALSAKRALSRTVILKEPSAGGEKGVMIVYFEYNFLRLLSGLEDFSELDENWTVIFATSWSPTDYSLLAVALNRIKGSIYVQACNYAEIAKLEAFHPRIRCLRSLPCDWLHPSFYQPKEWCSRSVDILMVSNWAPFKRHWELFQTLRKMPASLRVVCVGQEQDGVRLADIREMQRKIGAPQDIEYYESIPIEQVTQLQCDSKISVIFSLREGCCVAAAESLMGGAVLAMRRDAHVGPKAYINDGTGLLLTPGRAHVELMRALQEGHQFRSHEWARSNIACDVTLQKLTNQLRGDAAKAERPWTTGLALPCWRPYPMLFEEADRQRLAATYADLHRQFPTVFSADLMSCARN